MGRISKAGKFISAALVVVMVLSTLICYPPQASAATESTGTVNTASTNLREQPTTTSAVLTTMAKGASVTVHGSESGGWYKVTYQTYTGYVRGDFIDVLVTGLSDPGVVTIETQVREQPDATSAVTGTLAVQTEVTVTATYGSMYGVKAGNITGYVPQRCIHKYNVIILNLNATITSGNVNMRSLPNTSSEVVTVLSRGASVKAVSIQDHWVKITYSGKTGYVRGDFVNYNMPSGRAVTSMHPGMRGNAIGTLQVALRKRGFFHVAANGVYGNQTKAAVKAFQESFYLDADGYAGPQTLLLLFGASDVFKLWSNYRDEMDAQAPKQSGKVLLVDWFTTSSNKGMQHILPVSRKTQIIFTVIDARTGISWDMLRFGDITAHWHADVCTITKDDTANMKKAWGGEMNSSRRPVWVKHDGKYYAASLTGYVHNTDPIGNNGIDGQVCLHFRGSRVHATGRVDEAHQACIMEAFENAAKLDAYIDSGKV